MAIKVHISTYFYDKYEKLWLVQAIAVATSRSTEYDVGKTDTSLANDWWGQIRERKWLTCEANVKEYGWSEIKMQFSLIIILLPLDFDGN